MNTIHSGGINQILSLSRRYGYYRRYSRYHTKGIIEYSRVVRQVQDRLEFQRRLTNLKAEDQNK